MTMPWWQAGLLFAGYIMVLAVVLAFGLTTIDMLAERRRMLSDLKDLQTRVFEAEVRAERYRGWCYEK